jgi:hypothetical protein
MLKLYIESRSLFCGLLLMGLISSCNQVKDRQDKMPRNQTIINKDHLRNYVQKYWANKSVRTEEPIGYILINNICDTTHFFIGTDFNHAMIFDRKYLIIDSVEYNGISFPVYVRKSILLKEDTSFVNRLRKTYSVVRGFEAHDYNAWKISYPENQNKVKVDTFYSSVYHIRPLFENEIQKK